MISSQNLTHKFISFFNQIKKEKNENGYHHALFLIREKISYKLLNFFSYPLAILIACLRPWIKIRFMPVSCLTIGHYSLSIEVLLCKIDQAKMNKNEKIIYLQRKKSQVCNSQLYTMWKRVIPFSPDLLFPLSCHIENYLEKWYGVHPYKTFLGQASHDRWDILEKSKQHLRFTKEELIEGERVKMNMGIPPNAKFICLIARDEAHYKGNASYTNLSGYRNSDILSYQRAALFLANNGYFVLRMGKTVNNPFEVAHDKIIDYACSPFRSDFMDIYLSAHCYFFMTTLCGLDGIAHAFRRPILATNVTPHAYYHLGYPIKLFLAKKVLNKTTGNFVDFRTQRSIFNLGSHHHLIHQRIKEYSLEIIDNTEDEILEATQEMLLRMEEKWQETDKSEALHKQFWKAMSVETFETMPKCKYQPRYSQADLLKNRQLLNCDSNLRGS